MILPALLLLTSAVEPGCVELTSENIRVQDLAPSFAGFGRLDPGMIFGPAPAPGIRRFLSSFELRRFAERAGLRMSDIPGMCVVVPARTLNATEVLEAIRVSVDGKSAGLELVDFSRIPVPKGALVGDRAGLSYPANPAAPALWRGWVEWGEHRRVRVWAHVFVRVPKTVLVTARDLRPGEVITPEAVREYQRLAPVSGASHFTDLASVIGKQVRSRIRQGQELRTEMLMAAQVVQKGEGVEVRVTSGLSSLCLRATADSTARAGELVMLRNPLSGKRFRALAIEPGKAQLNLNREPR
jgi:flagella basal body P-ring formation protein FlgA